MAVRSRRLAIAASAFLLVTALAVAVRLGWTLAFDHAVLAAIREGGGARMRQPVVDITALGSGIVLTLAVLAAAALLLARREPWAALRLLGFVLGGRFAVDLVKTLVARARPPVADAEVVVHSFSFPSSHAANAAIIYLALAFVAGRDETRPAARALLLALAAGLVVAIGASRLWLGVHWPTDVIGGWLFGVGWIALAAAATAR